MPPLQGLLFYLLWEMGEAVWSVSWAEVGRGSRELKVLERSELEQSVTDIHFKYTTLFSSSYSL